MGNGYMPWFERDTGHKCVTLGASPWAFLGNGRLLSNFCEVLGIDTHEGLKDMLRMSGVDKYDITGGGSDFDKLQALAEVLPLWLGHPYVTAIHQLLKDLFDCPLPLSKDTLPHIWQYTAEKLTNEHLTVAHLLAKYGYDQMIYPAGEALPESVARAGVTPTPVWDATHMVNPYGKGFVGSPCDPRTSPQQVWAEQEAKLLSGLDAATAQGVTDVWVAMSGCHTYQRPHPYTAGQAYMQISQGGEVSPKEKDLFLSQMMRVLGQYAKEKNLHLVLCHVSPCVYQDMTAYLAGCGGDAPMTCVAYDPDNAVALAGLGAKVMLSVDLCATEGQVFQILNQVSSGMPIGCLAGLYLPATGLLDIPLVKRIYTLVDAWTAHMKDMLS